MDCGRRARNSKNLGSIFIVADDVGISGSPVDVFTVEPCEMKNEIRDEKLLLLRGWSLISFAWLIKGFFRAKGVARGAEGLSRPHDASEARNLRDSRCHVHNGRPLQGPSSFFSSP